jgi:hypothetical protein
MPGVLARHVAQSPGDVADLLRRVRDHPSRHPVVCKKALARLVANDAATPSALLAYRSPCWLPLR